MTPLYLTTVLGLLVISTVPVSGAPQPLIPPPPGRQEMIPPPGRQEMIPPPGKQAHDMQPRSVPHAQPFLGPPTGRQEMIPLPGKQAHDMQCPICATCTAIFRATNRKARDDSTARRKASTRYATSICAAVILMGSMLHGHFSENMNFNFVSS